MKPFGFFLNFTKSQRTGILALFILIVIIQAVYYIATRYDLKTDRQISDEEAEWLGMQAAIDDLKAVGIEKEGYTIYPFNPNFISDHKGYTLGMSVAEIERLHKFRKTGKYLNSAADFQKVTKVSDSLLSVISPYFKFPEWVTAKNTTVANTALKTPSYSKQTERKSLPVMDINEALEEDLDKVYGIGPVFAKKILRRRTQFGAFVHMDQMDDFKEFSPDAIAGLKKHFKVNGNPVVTKININTASLNQLSYVPYFNKTLARAIITERSMRGTIVNIEELLKINDFPVEKVKIIALYLEF